MSDAERQQPDPRTGDRPDPGPTPAPAPGEPDAPDPDALGAWPEGRSEAAPTPDVPRSTPEGEGAADPESSDAADPEVEAPLEDERSREELLAALAETEAQRDEYLDGVRRARAEFENYRKRSMREGASQREAGRVEVVEGLLEVLDDLDRTLDAAEASEDETLSRGIEMVAEKLVGALRSAGLERIGATGVPFDPNRHEAVQQTTGDEDRGQPVVVEVLRPGYALGERVLRAAMVVVEQ